MVDEPAAVVSEPVSVPEVVAPVSVVVVDPAPVTRVPSLGRVAAGVDRDRLLTLRSVRVQPRVVPVAPSSPSSPVVPEAIGYAGSLTLTRRDLELQATYGDPAKAAKYWQPQRSGDCVLISVADVIGLLTGKLPTEPQIVYQAMNLLSVNKGLYAGKMMYRGMRDSSKGAFYEDARNLLGRYGIDSNVHHFGNYGSHNTYYENEALEKLKTALSDSDKAIIASINAHVLWSKAQPGYNGEIPSPTANGNHAVVVTGYNPITDTITINDHAQSMIVDGKPLGRAWELPREVFMAAWNRSNYQTLIAERPDNPTIPTSAWKNLQPRRDSVALTTAKETPRRSR
ncbi:hypothetical protein PDG61_25050 [Mycolicibacterium sp. BiH015]|uniref:hypothetical protein n=1 Tax=Mycolicibacterium sp. BiH015 TaxID=3018808 RepID=UPI0022E45FDC|nr:hypothetical protein [Mycolicibacterium sp. BiH015]MDA2894200.1 hypothetical protein [Mycolicibacterium sp. BiH015]